MDIKEYRYIWEIARQGGISRAARELYISQPSLSVYLKNMEQRLGFPLFEQVDGRLRPTREGELYLDHAEQILSIDSALMESFERLRQNKSGLVRIGVAGTRLAYVLTYILNHCREEYPDIELKFVEGISRELEELVHHREVDFILVNLPFRKYPLEYQVLFDEQVVLAVPAAFPVCAAAEERPQWRHPWVDIQQLQDVPLTLLKPGQRLREIADRIFGEAGVSPSVFMETQSAETAMSLVRTGQSACFIYDSYVKNMPSAKVRAFCVGESPVYQQYVAAYPRNARLSLPAQAILGVILRHMKGFQLQPVESGE